VKAFSTVLLSPDTRAREAVHVCGLAQMADADADILDLKFSDDYDSRYCTEAVKY
jgi:hypothetical protein